MAWDFNCSFFFPIPKNTTSKSQIIIFDSCVFWAKVNLEATNASNNF